MDRKPQFIMYDNGDVVAYDPDKDSIDESKLVHSNDEAPNEVSISIIFRGDGSSLIMCPVTTGYEGACRWNDRNFEGASWDTDYVRFERSSAREGDTYFNYLDEGEDDEEEMSDYCAGFYWVGGQWYGIGECADIHSFKENYKGFTFYLEFKVDLDSERLVVGRYAGT